MTTRGGESMEVTALVIAGVVAATQVADIVLRVIEMRQARRPRDTD